MHLFFKFIHICKPKQVSVELFHESWTRFEYDDPTSLMTNMHNISIYLTRSQLIVHRIAFWKRDLPVQGRTEGVYHPHCMYSFLILYRVCQSQHQVPEQKKNPIHLWSKTYLHNKQNTVAATQRIILNKEYHKIQLNAMAIISLLSLILAMIH